MLKRLSISQKTLLLFGAVALLPLLLLNIFWLRSSQRQLKSAADARQSLLVSESAERVNEYIGAKIDSAIIHSQIASIQDFNVGQARLNLLEYAKQDNELQRIALVDKNGNEQVVINNSEFSSQLSSVKDSDAFRVVTFLSGKEYIGPVEYEDNKPHVTIAVPLISYTNRQAGVDLSTAEAGIRRGSGDIKGALMIKVGLENLWNSVLSARLGSNGYAYLIDDKGNVIAYPDAAFLKDHQNLRGVGAVDNATKVLASEDLAAAAENYSSSPQQTISETGVPVLSSNHPVARTKWAVIGEEPIASVYADASRVSRIALLIFGGSALIATILIWLSTRGVINPIRQLTSGAVRIGSGDFSHHINIRSHDELGTLANTFNQMGASLADLIRRYRLRNIDLNAERTKLKAVIDTITDGVIALNHDYSIALANSTAAKLIGKRPEELYNQPWLEIMQLSYNGARFRNNLLETELPYFKDVTLTTANATKYLDITAVRLSSDPSGIGYILTINDTTKSRELEIMRLDFVSMAAHELRTPLTAVRGYLNLLRSDGAIRSEDQNYLNRALASTGNLEGLINNLLSLSKIERGAVNFKSTKLNWNDLVASEVKNQQLAAADKQISITYQAAEQPIWVLGDELALREVLGNLISNAIHYTNAGGAITLTVVANAQGVETTVSDTGIGIPAAAQEKLFTKYYRVASGLTSGSQGTGIGLFICKSIVEAHNGSITVSSKEGRGSSFSFKLPPFDEAKYEALNATKPLLGKRSKLGWLTKSPTS